MITRKKVGIKRRFKAKKPLKRKPTKLKKKRATKADFKRSWGIQGNWTLRYTGLKGIYWYWFSKTIRNRDYEVNQGLCMTCNKYVEKGEDQCGHLFAARNCGFALLFHPMNNHLQHSKCNNPRFTPSAGIYNTLNIEQRYGVGTVSKLAELKKTTTKEWSKAEYEEKIKELPAYLRSLIESLR